MFHFVLRLFREKPLGAAGGVIFILFLLCGIFADVLAPYGMNQISPRNRLLAPSWAYPFGTDNLGRDVLSRIIAGARVSAIVTIYAIIFSGAIGTLLGITAGYFGGIVDTVIVRIAEIKMAIPGLALALIPSLIHISEPTRPY